MTIKRRIERLEQTSPTGTDLPQSVVIEFHTPGESGSSLAALKLQPLSGGRTVDMKREPGEDETAFRARFDEHSSDRCNLQTSGREKA